jgi:hypothetical protein
MAEQRRVPAAAIMTSAFVDAAELMARVLGADDHRFVTIEHPMASADDAELHRRGRLAADRCLVLLVGG